MKLIELKKYNSYTIVAVNPKHISKIEDDIDGSCCVTTVDGSNFWTSMPYKTLLLKLTSYH
jgi:hypothetical protein